MPAQRKCIETSIFRQEVPCGDVIKSLVCTASFHAEMVKRNMHLGSFFLAVNTHIIWSSTQTRSVNDTRNSDILSGLLTKIRLIKVNSDSSLSGDMRIRKVYPVDKISLKLRWSMS